MKIKYLLQLLKKVKFNLMINYLKIVKLKRVMMIIIKSMILLLMIIYQNKIYLKKLNMVYQ